MNIAAALFGFILAVCYWPGISGPATSPRWALGVVLVAALFLFRIRVTWAHVIGAAFVIWSLATFYWSQSQPDSVGIGFNLIIIAAAFCVGGQLTTLRPLIAGLALGLGVSAVVAALQLTGVAVLPDIAVYSRIPGLFANPLIYAEIAALVTVAALAERMWWAVPLTFAGIVVWSKSRGVSGIDGCSGRDGAFMACGGSDPYRCTDRRTCDPPAIAPRGCIRGGDGSVSSMAGHRRLI